ncbi:zinc finger BED domain-containing protein RICESLEEPER 2-like [Humulus lupulus]|uniref:zinc finger BED domain-containing protein RICESLEEPER 2-like n=1 Tax=Humulus lupulus TaxID=3486 RepID=UPI002B414351|nr:zinc finger BED domain-containing protein RICESLEEPER 2-like [Humulus lupulus]
MFHMRCCAHILNLVVSDGLKEMSGAISSIRNAVRFVRSSPARLKRFKEACKDVNVESKALLCLDVVTRWNSTYMMLEVALKFKKAFRYLEGDANYTKYFEEERVNGEKVDGPPDNTDWTNAEVFFKFLKAFYELTLKFSGSLYVTSNLFFQEILEVQVELNDMNSSTDELMSKMAGSMQLKFDKYWAMLRRLTCCNILPLFWIQDSNWMLFITVSGISMIPFELKK